MESSPARRVCPLVIFLSLLCAVPAAGQDPIDVPEVPSQFKLDMETAARLKPQLMAQSVAVSVRYATGKLVFDRLAAQFAPQSSTKFSWHLRIVEDGQLNAYSSPDGTVYVESGLARLAGSSAGLWAAILSHEIAHIVRRDWARRYLYQKYLENGGGTVWYWAIRACLPARGEILRGPAPTWGDSGARWNWRPTAKD